MTAEQLRNSILQEAISGRLVPHDPNEEPASVLLARIREEKERLIKEKKLKKEKPSAPITEDEKPYEIPATWEWCRIQDIQYLLTDGTHNRPQYAEKGVPFVSVKDISTGRLNLNNTKFISPEDHKILSKRCNPQYGDLLVSKVGTTGVPVLVDTKHEFSLFVSVALIKYFAQYTLPQYLIYLINSPLVQNQVKEHTRGVGNKNWVLNDIYNTVIVLPPYEEQKRIVAKLEELLPIVEQYGKAQTELDKLNTALPIRLRQSILQEAMLGKLVQQDPKDDSAISLFTSIQDEMESLVKAKVLKKTKYTAEGEQEDAVLPETWMSARLADICQLTDGEKKSGKFVCLDAKYLRGKSKGDYLMSGKFVVKGEKIILVDGENSGEVFVTPCDGYMGSTFKQLWVSSKMYLPYVLYFIAFHKNHLRNSKKGAAIPHLNKDIFYNLSIGIPPLAEQQRIVAKIEELFAEIDKLK